MEENEEKEKKNTLDKEALCECLKTSEFRRKWMDLNQNYAQHYVGMQFL